MTSDKPLISQLCTQAQFHTEVFAKWLGELKDTKQPLSSPEIVKKLTAQGHEVSVNFNYGTGVLDMHIDESPYSRDKHLRLRVGKFAVTSLGLIIRRNPNAT